MDMYINALHEHLYQPQVESDAPSLAVTACALKATASLPLALALTRALTSALALA